MDDGVARQLVEKAIEHISELYVLFVDLAKAYDSIPRPALSSALGSLGVPPVMLSLTKSLHDSMEAWIRSYGTLSDTINVNNGLCYRCYKDIFHQTTTTIS